MTKHVYSFKEGNATMRDLLGGKGANLAEMTRLGLPVPGGFTITTETCMTYLKNGCQLQATTLDEMAQHLQQLEKESGKEFNSKQNLMLLSVRSGSKFSMPGMMDTILNLGLNDVNVEYLKAETGNGTFAYDCYRRLLQMFGDVVYGISGQKFENYLSYYKQKQGVELDSDLTEDDLKNIVEEFKNIYIEVLNKPFPQDPQAQLLEAVEAVFKSWDNDRAKIYRELHDIADDLGTAVNIQLMVFGNSGEESGTGVAFTRNPSTGEHKLYGEYLINAQGEDVVAGIRTPQEIQTLADKMPEVYQQFTDMAQSLEKHYGDMQDIEFTIDKGKLYLLQTRNGKRTAQAAVRIAVELEQEGLITKQQAIMMIDPDSINQLLHPVFVQEALEQAVLVSGVGLPASPGSATGKICFDAASAKELAQKGERVILVRQETSPEDIEGMIASEAIVTSRGGMTSHAAVVARGMGTCCVAGCNELDINEELRTVTYPGGVLTEGDTISVDGTNGNIYLGAIDVKNSEKNADFETILSWAKAESRMGVRMNAETIPDIKTGFDFDATGIGLVRTEHMFFAPERLKEMRRFILSEDFDGRQAALNVILEYQVQDFYDIFKTAEDRSAVVRLLDPPLHEFLPMNEGDIIRVAEDIEVPVTDLKRRVNELHEINPMLGHRGCRLAMTYPELYLMQGEAIIRSAIRLKKEQGLDVQPEIMIPLVGMEAELRTLRDSLKENLDAIIKEEQVDIFYTIGTMIEIPRACFIADQLAVKADFFSFGTNDLTQMAYGFSRDDAAKFIGHYVENGVLPVDPFQTIDIEGVGRLMEIAVSKAREVNPEIKIGVCGELGGDPRSIEFFDGLGLDYVSCSPFRVPIAYLAAAQSTIKKNQ